MKTKLRVVPAQSVEPSLDEIREASARDIYADTRQLWRQEDRWRLMWIKADKARGWR